MVGPGRGGGGGVSTTVPVLVIEKKCTVQVPYYISKAVNNLGYILPQALLYY